MKKILLVCLLVFVKGFSQTVSLPDLMALQVKPQQEIKQQLIDAKWKLVDERFSEKHGFGDMTFLSTQTPEASAIQLKVFYGLDKASQTRLQLRIKTNEQFTQVKSSIAQTNLQFSRTAVDGNNTTTVFKNNDVTVTILATRAVGASVTYEILVESNDYDPKMYNFSLGK